MLPKGMLPFQQLLNSLTPWNLLVTFNDRFGLRLFFFLVCAWSVKRLLLLAKVVRLKNDVSNTSS